MVFSVLLKFYTTITILFFFFLQLFYVFHHLISLPFCTLECRLGSMSTLNGNEMISVELNT